MGPRGKERSGDPGPRGADAPPLPGFCPVDSDEEAPGERSADAEDAEPPEAPAGRPPDEACVPPAHALLLGGFGKSRAPRVRGRPGGGRLRGCQSRRCWWRGGGRMVSASHGRSAGQRRTSVEHLAFTYLFIFIGVNPEQIVLLL